MNDFVIERNQFNAFKTFRTPGKAWHCPHCSRMNYEPGGKYEDECNITEVMYNEPTENCITFWFECPHCHTEYSEIYRATYINTYGEKGFTKGHYCHHCATEREEPETIPCGWYYFDAEEDNVIWIGYYCENCEEEQFERYQLDYVRTEIYEKITE